MQFKGAPVKYTARD